MAKSNKTFPKNSALSKLAIAIVCANSGMALSTPSGGIVTSGTASIAADQLSVDQSQNAVNDVVTIQWDEFNIDDGQTFTFTQDPGDVAINNILDADPSSILGNIEAGGTVFLSNTNGFIFGASSTINTGSFLATTSTINHTGDSLTLTNNPDSNPNNNNLEFSINIHKDASINANNQNSGGYLAFISNNILIDSTTTTNNSNAGLHAKNGEILLSNDVNSTIKLAGLNINFPASDFNGASDNNINLTDAIISSESVILTSKNLTDLLDNVIKQPESLTIENLSFSAPDITALSDISTSIEDSFKLLEASESKNSLNITTDSLATNNNIDVSNISGLNNANQVELNIAADTISVKHNINGSNLDLNLNANTSITIDNLSQDFGGDSGFNSFSATATNIYINENISTKNDLSLNGDISINVASFDPFFQSISGDIIVNGTLTGTNTGTELGELFLTGDNIYLNAVSGFNSVDLEANSIYLSGNVSANRIASNNQSNILLRNDISMNAQIIEFDSATFTSAPEDPLTPNTLYSLNLVGTAIGAGSENRFILNDTRISAGNGLRELNIKSLNAETTTNIFLGGDYDTAKFCIHSCAATGTTEIDYNTVLTSKTHFNDIDALNFSESSLSGDYKLTAMGNADSVAGLSLVTGLDGLSFTNFTTITLRDDISTKEQGLELFSEFIKIENTSKDDKTVLISNSNSGDITIGDIITRSDDGIVSSPMSSTISSGNGSSLSIDTKNSHVYLGTVNQLANLSISKELQDEGSTVIANKIITSDSISFNNLGTITSAQNSDASINKTLTLEAANNITLTDSDLITPDHDVNLTSGDIKLERITASNINLDASNIELSGDLFASNDLNLLESNEATNIILTQDITLTGKMDILSESNTTAKITGSKNLYLTSKNTDIYLSSFNPEGELNSLSITTLDASNPANIHVTSDATGLIKLPQLTGAQGLSLLGYMSLDLGENKAAFFDTSSYDGNLNLSGVNITGLGSLKFDTGTGELSLGDIGTNNSDSQIFEALDIQSTGKLNIHGELNIQSTEFDFSKLNSIDLHTDLTLGSTDALAVVNFGSASINGTHDLSLFTTELTLSSVGNNIALQDLNIFNESDTALVLDNDITVVGSVNISSTSLELDNSITNTGLAVNISTIGDLIMKKDSVINADYSDITLTSTTGNIGIGKLFAGNSVTVRSELGYLYNNINDYVSNDSTSTNITSTNQDLYGLVNIGESVSSPIVINALNGGSITAESSGTIYIANLANARMNTTGRVIDGSTGGETATIDAFTQFKLSSLNTTNLPTLSSNLDLISNQTWQVDEDESIRKIKSPSSAPSIYYSRNGWRLGHK